MSEENRQTGENQTTTRKRRDVRRHWGAAFAFVLAAAFAAALVFGGSSTKTDAANDRFSASIGVAVGIDGVYKSGFPTQVVLSWDAPEDGAAVETLELETVDSDGTPFVVSRPATAEEIASRRAELLGIFPKANGKLTVRLRAANGRVAEKTFVPTAKNADKKNKTAAERDAENAENSPRTAVFLPPAPSSKPIYLVVGAIDEKLGVSEAFGELRWRDERRPNVVQVAKFSDLPTDFRALESVERLIFSTTDPEYFANVDATDPRIKAIERWVERGGDVVLTAGPKSIPLLKDGGALSAFAPGAAVADKPHEFRVVNSLVVELKNVKNLALTGARAFPFLNVPVVSELKPNVVVEMREAETPLLTARPVGLGTVVFFAADLSTPPFSNWSGRGKLWLKIFGFDAESATAKASSSAFVKRGFNDVSGQLRGALDVFDGVRVVPFSLVLTAIFLFLLLIGPADWFLAKKIVKRPLITWATFPIFVVAACVLVVCVSNATRPSAERLNRAEILDVDVESGIVRDAFWLGFYSPAERRYDLKIGPKTFATDALTLDESETVSTLSPLTLDGSGIGGAEEKAVATRLWDAPYSASESGAAAELAAVPTATRSSKSFAGRWSSRLSGLPKAPELVDDGLTLRGSVVNPFDVPIYSAFVVYPGGAYSLGTLAPGETPIDRTSTRQEAKRVLNEHQSSIPTDELDRWDATSYRLDSTRIPYILRAMSFYRFAGDEEAFGLAKRLQADVDLSDLLRCGRAVVFGTIVDSEAEKYRPVSSGERRAADAVELSRLNRIIADQKGDETKTPRELAVEKYGEFGSTDAFEPTAFSLKKSASGDETETPEIAGKRTVVVRLIVPLKRGAAPTTATK